jgi:hypothetical protein
MVLDLDTCRVGNNDGVGIAAQDDGIRAIWYTKRVIGWVLWELYYLVVIGEEFIGAWKEVPLECDINGCRYGKWDILGIEGRFINNGIVNICSIQVFNAVQER